MAFLENQGSFCSFEDMAKKVNELSEALSKQKKIELELRESEEQFRSIVENSYDIIYRLNIQTNRFDYASPSLTKLLGYTWEEIQHLGFDDVMSFIHPDDMGWMQQSYATLFESADKSSPVEFRIRHKTEGYRWISDTRDIVYTDRHEPLAIVGILRDISKQKQTEKDLEQIRNDLELLVRERTSNLEEANTAMKVLLNRRESDMKDVEENLAVHIKDQVQPLILKLKRSGLNKKQRACLDMMESTINAMFEPLSRSLSSKFIHLTHMEIQVANLVMQGKTSKEIAERLHLSQRTIDTHRYNIRSKLNIPPKANLRVYLLSCEN